MRLLLLDTCGDNASLALAQGGRVLRERTLPPRAASTQLIAVIRNELSALEWPLASLHAVGAVSGPGSFTGVRVGLAAAKGLCEVAGLRMAAVSRLAVLRDAAGGHTSDLAVLDAGRGEFYMRSGEEEALLTHAELTALVGRAGAVRVLVTEERLMTSLALLNPEWVELAARHALGLVQERLSAGGDPVDAAEANYVRSARALYPAQRLPIVAGKA